MNNLLLNSIPSDLKNTAIVLIGTIKIFVPLKGIIDLESEKEHKKEQIGQKQKSIDGLQSRLNNEIFVSKAPKEIIAKEKGARNEFEIEEVDLLTKGVTFYEGS